MPTFVKNKNMRALIVFISVLIFSLSSLYAQQKTYIWGYLKDSVTNEPIASASVTNNTTRHTVITNNKGIFKLELAENQVLTFAAVGYYFDTVSFHPRLLIHDTLYLELKPLLHSLGNVTVTTTGWSAYQLDSMDRRKEFFENIVQYKIPTVSPANSGAGFALNLDRFSRKEKNKRKAFQFFEAYEREAYINYRFTPQLVTKYTGLTNDALQQFMQKYRPSYEWLRANTSEEDIKYYINEQLKINNKK